MPVDKSVRQQVDEIRELVSGATETLQQANWAMQTLAATLAEARPASVVPARAVPLSPPPEDEVVDDEPRLDVAPSDDAAPELPQRHRRWVRGIRAPSRGQSGE